LLPRNNQYFNNTVLMIVEGVDMQGTLGLDQMPEAEDAKMAGAGMLGNLEPVLILAHGQTAHTVHPASREPEPPPAGGIARSCKQQPRFLISKHVDPCIY
jgi:hypothetical protein